MGSELTTEDAFRKLAEVVHNAATAHHTSVSFVDRAGGTTRFANSQIVQNVNTRRATLTISAAFGQKHGSATTTDLSEASVTATVQRAEEIAQAATEDPEYLPPLAEQDYPVLPTLRAETAAAGPARRIAEARRIIELCRAHNLDAAGIVENYSSAFGLTADTGLFAYEQRGEATFSVTALGEDASGWASNTNRSIDDLDVETRTHAAIEKARRSADPRELTPGRYTVILESAAVLGLLAPLMWALDARAYHKGTSPLAGKLDQRIIDARLTLQNRPDHPALLGSGFNDYGLPGNYRTWIERGVLKELDYDRFTAREHDVAPSSALDAPYLSGEQAAGESVDDLLKGTERAILVTRFWYIRSVNPNDLTLTGMTRDGTFLVEDGQVTSGLINFRWHDSPLRALDNILALTTPLDAAPMWGAKAHLPAMKIGDFNFTSVTRF
ncbi:MAG: TldD/PmbA family protein [Planctomycetes bacterium]|nr:TldD/PmbA family protein [Planctomycetota bacterium]